MRGGSRPVCDTTLVCLLYCLFPRPLEQWGLGRGKGVRCKPSMFEKALCTNFTPSSPSSLPLPPSLPTLHPLSLLVMPSPHPPLPPSSPLSSISLSLSPPHSATEYNRVILGRHADLLDILFAFPSCQPSLDRLIRK